MTKPTSDAASAPDAAEADVCAGAAMPNPSEPMKRADIVAPFAVDASSNASAPDDTGRNSSGAAAPGGMRQATPSISSAPNVSVVSGARLDAGNVSVKP